MIFFLVATFCLLQLNDLACTPDRNDPDASLETMDARDSRASDDPIMLRFSFDAPDARLKLAGKLDEISGITALANGTLATVQDERGKIYILDPTTGEILEDFRFAKDGDFEDIEQVGNLIYALRSDGDLYVIDGWKGEEADARKIETALSSKNDTEGLTFDPLTNRLLILCKEDAGQDIKRKKAIYGFDLASQQLTPDPVYLIDLEKALANLRENPINRTIRRWLTPFQDASGFKPAAIARDPISGHYLVVSSARKVMLELDPAGRPVAAQLLPERLFPQPESLTFLPDGTLFIANEAGDQDAATLLRFNRR